jgi:hypothetical protein
MIGGKKPMSLEKNSNTVDILEGNNIINNGILPKKHDNTIRFDFSKENLINGIILSELLGSPKALRKRERSGRKRQISKMSNVGE